MPVPVGTLAQGFFSSYALSPPRWSFYHLVDIWLVCVSHMRPLYVLLEVSSSQVIPHHLNPSPTRQKGTRISLLNNGLCVGNRKTKSAVEADMVWRANLIKPELPVSVCAASSAQWALLPPSLSSPPSRPPRSVFAACFLALKCKMCYIWKVTSEDFYPLSVSDVIAQALCFILKTQACFV